MIVVHGVAGILLIRAVYESTPFNTKIQLWSVIATGTLVLAGTIRLGLIGV